MSDKPAETTVEELVMAKPSKLQKLGSVALGVGVIVIPTVMGAAAGAYGFKVAKMNLDTAKMLNQAASTFAATVK